MKLINSVIISTILILTSASAIAGDAAAGKATFNSKGCIGCHGAGGGSPTVSNPPTPVLKGKEAAYLIKQLKDFKSGARKSATMNAMAPMLNDADVENVASYLSSQK